jgi:ribosomal protein S18 acetylase RimI-like enzyme
MRCENGRKNGRGTSLALSFALRRANLDDLPALLAVQAQCYSPQMNEPETVWRQRLQQAAALCWLAESGGAIHAYLAAYPARLGHVTALDGDFAPPPLANCLYLHDLAVSPDASGSGLGKALLTRALHTAQERGWRHAALVCVQDAAGFWQGQGFAATALPDSTAQAALASYPGPACYMTRPL